MPKYKPMLVAFDERGYNEAIQKGNQKTQIFKDAMNWCNQYTYGLYLEAFAKSFTKEFTQRYYEANKNKIQLDIKIDKLLELVGINIFELRDLEDKFNNHPSDFYVNENGFGCKVERRPYEHWTSSSEQNEKLRMGRKLIEAIEACNNHTKIYPVSIQQATSNFITYDIRKGEYNVQV